MFLAESRDDGVRVVTFTDDESLLVTLAEVHFEVEDRLLTAADQELLRT